MYYCKQRIAANFNRAVASYDQAANFQRDVGRTLLNSLTHISTPQRILELGSGTGFITAQLHTAFPQTQITSIDIADQMCHATQLRCTNSHVVCADIENLPFQANYFDLVISNLALQWCADLNKAFSEITRVCQPKANVIFSSLGPNSLHELNQAWEAVDPLPRVNLFTSIETLIAAGQHAKLATKRTQQIKQQRYFEHVIDVLKQLKGIGATTLCRPRQTSLQGKSLFSRLQSAYPKTDQKIIASYEVIYAHWHCIKPI